MSNPPMANKSSASPCCSISLARDWGTLTGLPYFRLRQFPDPVTGRPTTGVTVRDEKAIFESKDKRFNPDAALRYTHTIDVFDIGLSYFKGMARTPVLDFGPETYDGVSVVPRYDLISQAGIDVQATIGPWLLKLEGTRRQQRNQWITQATGGVEYTLYNIFDTGTDLGIVAEYMYDQRRMDAPQPFNDDVGFGLRWRMTCNRQRCFWAAFTIWKPTAPPYRWKPNLPLDSFVQSPARSAPAGKGRHGRHARTGTER